MSSAFIASELFYTC